ncbi:hypothetical protein MKZ38_008838 [Zalerion maritima]|uniref:Uncharacterized protein n=1 Tax=Zalerion maritima TaxID=339359 RepID=A0AAD5RU16_9PEZI|nr:hypothetical protein MKZ38_008838 [Zalerion maritima]
MHNITFTAHASFWDWARRTISSNPPSTPREVIPDPSQEFGTEKVCLDPVAITAMSTTSGTITPKGGPSKTSHIVIRGMDGGDTERDAPHSPNEGRLVPQRAFALAPSRAVKTNKASGKCRLRTQGLCSRRSDKIFLDTVPRSEERHHHHHHHHHQPDCPDTPAPSPVVGQGPLICQPLSLRGLEAALMQGEQSVVAPPQADDDDDDDDDDDSQDVPSDRKMSVISFVTDNGGTQAHSALSFYGSDCDGDEALSVIDEETAAAAAQSSGLHHGLAQCTVPFPGTAQSNSGLCEEREETGHFWLVFFLVPLLVFVAELLQVDILGCCDWSTFEAVVGPLGVVGLMNVLDVVSY